MRFKYIDIYLKSTDDVKRVYTKRQLISTYKKLSKRDIIRVVVYLRDGAVKEYKSSLSIDYMVSSLM